MFRATICGALNALGRVTKVYLWTRIGFLGSVSSGSSFDSTYLDSTSYRISGLVELSPSGQPMVTNWLGD